MSLRELRGVLNEELAGLPERYRVALVLCGIEEKSLDEAARAAGWTKGAVKGRLQRGRELLRTRLRRRGLELPAALFATGLALNSASAQVTATLADSTLRAALKVAAGEGVTGGVVSAEVAALVQGASKTMFSSKAKIATVLLITLSLAAATFGVAWRQAYAAEPPPAAQDSADKAKTPGDQPAPNAQPKPGADATNMVRGQVLDPDGKPVAGAKLYLGYAGRTETTYPVRATSGDDGRYSFPLEKTAPDDPTRQVLAVAKGFGCDWANVDSAEKELTLKLIKDVPISGRILDPEGRPVAGAKIAVTDMKAPKENHLDQYLEAVRKGNAWQYPFAKSWTGPVPGLPATLTTGADGRFKLNGVGSERVANFRLEGPGIASAGLEVMTRAGEKVGSIHAASFDYLAVASRPIRGVVREKATGKPIGGASLEINLYRWRGHSRWAKAITDKEGRYELLGLDKLPSYPLEVKPPNGLHFQRSAELQDTPGLDPLTVDIEVVQGGVTVRGKVTDKATGKPIANARIDYHPLYPNANVNKLNGFWNPRSETSTGSDGTYVLSVLAGPGVIGIAAPKTDAYVPAHTSKKERKDFFKLPLGLDQMDDPVPAVGGNAVGLPLSRDSYNAMVLVEPGEKDESLVKDVALDAARTLKGRVVGPDGEPLTGVTVTGLFQRSFDTLKGAEFTVRAVNPRATRQLTFYHKDKNLGFFLKELRGDAPEPLTVKLEPCGSASGRIVDGDGQPLAGFRFGLGGWGGSQQAITDKEGRFRVEGLIPGMSYGLMPSTGFFILADVTVESGKNKDMGDVKNRTQ